MNKYPFLFLPVLLIGCSSIIDGTSQEIMVNTNPSGAMCVFERNGMPVGTVGPTPSAIVVKKSKYDIVIKCDKEGYQTATYFNKSGSAGATFGNIVAGGLIGWGIDSASGADNKYDSPINITLAPVGTSPLPVQGASSEEKKPDEKSEEYPKASR